MELEEVCIKGIWGSSFIRQIHLLQPACRYRFLRSDFGCGERQWLDGFKEIWKQCDRKISATGMHAHRRTCTHALMGGVPIKKATMPRWWWWFYYWYAAYLTFFCKVKSLPNMAQNIQQYALHSVMYISAVDGVETELFAFFFIYVLIALEYRFPRQQITAWFLKKKKKKTPVKYLTVIPRHTRNQGNTK